MKLNPSSPYLYGFRAEVYLRKKDLTHAMQDFKEMKRLAPTLPGVQERIDAVQAELDKSAKKGDNAKGGAND
jgi:hypothetical protein